MPGMGVPGLLRESKMGVDSEDLLRLAIPKSHFKDEEAFRHAVELFQAPIGSVQVMRRADRSDPLAQQILIVIDIET